MIVETNISWGYKDLIEIFMTANELDVIISERSPGMYQTKITLTYNDASETATSITFLSYRHLGFENMLYDYLIKCGVSQRSISYGKYGPARDPKKLDADWEVYRKETLGFN